MKVFISWSGTKSRTVALALRNWLPGVIHSVEPFVSSKDIYAGTRWQAEVSAQLESTNFGIVCVTRDNQTSPWLNFEAGALAKAVENSRVVPLAIDLKPSDIQIPLGQFQAQPTTEQGIGEILTSINAACPSPLSDEILARAMKVWWPELGSELAEIEERAAPRGTAAQPNRSDRELIEETLDTVRSLARNRARGPVDKPIEDTLPEGHPLIDELNHLVSGYTPDVMVIRSQSRRRLGIRSPQLPQEIQDEANRLGDIYGVAIDFLTKRTSPIPIEPLEDSPPADGD